jgi:outer membrane lipoprotein SlyB
MNFTNKFIATLFALAALLPMSFFPGATHAQPSVAAPKIDGFDVEPAQQLIPGSDLLFTLYGSPGGVARVRISGATTTVPLEETEAGVYEGTYTIKLRDKITATSTATANLRLGNRVASALLDEPLVAGARVAAQPAPPPGGYPPRIDRFGVDPGNRLVPGEDLIFTLIGTPGGDASVKVVGVKGKIDLHEVAPGRYEGGYTIKNRDRIAENAAVTASLRVGGQITTVPLGQSLVASAGSAPRPGRVSRHCANCGVVEAINPIDVEGKGSFLGTIVGGVAGGLVGSQIGSGRGTTAAEIAGAVGGAFAGNEIEKRVKKTRHFEVVVRLENGGTQTISYPTQPAMRVGDRVRVENGTLVPNV